MTACKRLFLLFLQHHQIAESKKASTHFRLNENQKVFFVTCAVRNSTLQSQNCYSFVHKCQKTTQALLFLIRTEFSFFYDLEFILFRLFLILFFVAETGIVPDLLLNFEQK